MTDPWITRMAARAKARQAAQEEAARPPDEDAWREFVEARGGFSAYRIEDTYGHAHYAHGNAAIDAATGRCLGVFSIVVEEDAPSAPDVCPVCRDFSDYGEADRA